MSKKRILVVDDEKDVTKLVDYNLAKDGYLVDCAFSGEAALRSIKMNRPDLVILDLMLPGIDGLELCSMLKRDQKYCDIPIIILSAKGDEIDIVTGLELGADDYVTKPFSPRVLIARVRSVLRRHSVEHSGNDKILKVHGIKIDPLQFNVEVGNKTIELTNTEFHLLYYLAQKPGRVYTRCQIIDGVKGESYPATDRTVDVQIVNLRKKLGAAGKYIETVRGIGYRFKE